MTIKLFYCIIILRFGKTNVMKEEFYAAKKTKTKQNKTKKQKKNWNVNVDYIIIVKSVEIKMFKTISFDIV